MAIIGECMPKWILYTRGYSSVRHEFGLMREQRIPGGPTRNIYKAKRGWVAAKLKLA